MSRLAGSGGLVRASFYGNQLFPTRLRLGARALRLGFAVLAILTAVYATVLSGESLAWQAAYWILALFLIVLVARLARVVERCEREAFERGGSRITAHPMTDMGGGEIHTPRPAVERRLTHLEQIVIRQHRFAADAAHELRAPLTALSLIGENVLAKKGATAAELRDAIDSMLAESVHMNRLIEGLLELTRASLANTAETGSAALDLSELASGCVETLQILAEEKQQNIELTIPGPLWASADRTLVRQAVLNVIHNAIEHCPPGARIRVETLRGLPEQGQIRVQDDGPGIAPDEHHRVFERFYRGSGTARPRGATDRTPVTTAEVVRPSRRSLGLGLSITKAILCSQGGGIELHSRQGAGSCFILTLPLASQHSGGPGG